MFTKSTDKVAPGMKKIDLFNDKLKQNVKELRESSNITEEKGRDDWLDLPPSSLTKKKKTYHTNRTER